MTKICSRCSKHKPLFDFTKNKTKPGGVASDCKACRRTASAIFYKKNKTYMLERMKKWRKENPHYNEKRKEHSRLSIARWRKNNPEKVKKQKAARRAALKRATPSWLTADQRYAMKNVYDNVKWTDKTVDHIIPIRGKDVCGLHVPWNLQLLSSKANSSKGVRYDRQIIPSK